MQTEQVGFRDDEIEVLVVDLGDLFRSAVLCREGSKVLEQRAGNRGQEIDIGGLVEVPRQVFRDGSNVFLGGLDEVDDGNVGDWMARRV